MTHPDPVGERLAALTDWRGDTLRRIRALIQAAEHGNARACVSLARATLSDGSAGGCVPCCGSAKPSESQAQHDPISATRTARARATMTHAPAEQC